VTYGNANPHRWGVASGAALAAALATGAAFLAPGAPAAMAADGTTTTTTAIPYNCSAAASGTELGRSSWVAATNAPASQADAPANALDGNLASRFSTNEDQAAGLFFQVDLGTASTFDRLAMFSPNSPNDYARAYDVDVSNDGQSWTTVAACTGNGAAEIVAFPAQTARYVRVELTKADSSYWWSIDEFDLYSNAPAPTTTTSTTTREVATSTSLSSSANPVTVGDQVTYTATVSPVPNGGTLSFFTAGGAAIAGCTNIAVGTKTGAATCSSSYLSSGDIWVKAVYSGNGDLKPSSSGAYKQVVNLPAPGYWLVTSNGQVYAMGSARVLGAVPTSAATGPVVGIAATIDGQGYWVVTANGTVTALGDAKFYGDLPNLGKHVSDIVAIAPTSDGQGYYLVGADGGFFTFGDAKFHGSLPGAKIHVRDIVGMVSSPNGAGYLLVGADGGVFTFGNSRFYGSLPGLGKHVTDIRAILPSSTGQGYILVGSDGGAFTFGTGVRFHGSLPGEGVRTSDIVGIALTPDDGGYYMASAGGMVYSFGDAPVWGMPNGVGANLPVAAIAGT